MVTASMTCLIRRTLIGAVAFAPLAALAQSPPASPTGPVASIEALHTALLDIMRNAERLGVKGREQRIRPVMLQIFNLPAMARIACGRPWNDFTPAQQQAVAQAFTD